MQPVATMKSWGHHLHDGMLSMRHHINEHLHSRHFWTGVGITLLVIGFVALFVYFATKAPLQMEGTFPYGYPYAPYR